MEKWEHLRIPLADVTSATNGFKKEIGRGGYGSVYEGQLSFKGKLTKIAAKKLNEKHGQGLKEFLTEIDLLSGQQHENIITLIGYCDEGNEMIIVYEHAEHGSLDRYIRCSSGSYSLTWLERLKIVVEVASGLDHLHNHLHNHQVIIHRDIKSSNILLDEKWVAKISDLGLSKSTFSGFGRTTVISHACGTSGYVEPEYIHYGLVSRKSDVYSFGMVLFELLCGRLCTIRGNDGILLLADVAKEHYKEDKLDMIIHPSLLIQMNQEVLSRYSVIAYKCLLGRKDRPPIDVVKKELEEMLKLETRIEELRRIKSVWRSCEENIVSDEYLKRLTVFSVDEIKAASCGFAVENFLGAGFFGEVYSGNISGTKVAMKRINKINKEEGGQLLLYLRFLKEMGFLSACDHVNIISLVGYCDDQLGDDDERILVYEYMSNGSLYDYLWRLDQDKIPQVTVEQRLQICIGVAKGLNYLHSGGNHFNIIVHGDISLNNILLDHNLIPKLSNFKSSRASLLFVGSSSVNSQQAVITSNSTIDQGRKGDVQAFGRVLSEVLYDVGINNNNNNIPPNAAAAAGEVLDHRRLKHHDEYYDETTTRRSSSSIVSVECIHECENLIRHCLEKEPPAMSEVVELALKLQMGRYILIPPSQLKFVYKRFMTDFF